jgi:hypothetical protein
MLFRICKFSRKVGWEEIMQAGFYRGKVALIIDPETRPVWRFLCVSTRSKTTGIGGNY